MCSRWRHLLSSAVIWAALAVGAPAVADATDAGGVVRDTVQRLSQDGDDRSDTELVRPKIQTANPFSSLLGSRKREGDEADAPSARVMRYELAAGGRAVLFEQYGGEARIKYLCAPGDLRADCRLGDDRGAEEIYVLRAASGPRGATVFRDLDGRVAVQIASYGGAIVFWPGEDRGLGASPANGPETSLRLAFASVSTARARAEQASVLVTEMVGRPVNFQIRTVKTDPLTGAAVASDAIVRAARGLQFVARDRDGATALARSVSEVRFLAAPKPSLALNRGVLAVRYDPAAGVRGRPSSARIASFLEEAL